MDSQDWPLRDHGSSAKLYNPTESDIQDHRSHSTVFIGLHLPKHGHRHKRRKHHRTKGDRTLNEQVNKDEITHPAQRVQFLLGEDEDEEHKAHDLFCEMEELFYNGDQMEWKESARWIKFEEDVEEGGERWSKPHVATLSLHSLFELRCNILNGTVMFDVEAFDLTSLVELVIDKAVAAKQLEEPLKDRVREILLLRHRHQNQKRGTENGGSKLQLPSIRSFADIGKKGSVSKALGNIGDERDLSIKNDQLLSAKSTPNFHHFLSQEKPKTRLDAHPTYAGSLASSASAADLQREKQTKNLHFMKKIPPGAEAANILVGEVDFLTYPIVAFVRLLHPFFMPDLTEVPVPTKFVFIMLGPMGNQSKYHEIGRAIATLMSDEVFHDVAYHARNRDDLLAGIDEFLDQVTVLPPGEWDPSIRIEPPKKIPSQVNRKNFDGTTPLPNGKAVEFDIEEPGHEDPSLRRTGRLCGGLFDDIRRRLPWYLSDLQDSFHVQCFASFVFLYFASLTPIITFGTFLADETDNQMGALESIFAAALCGVIYALTAAQPLAILGFTGPVLVFEKILYDLCRHNGWNYLEFRFWIGMWIAAILLFIVVFDLSALVQYVTRFTEEGFALLISLIFVVEAFEKLFHVMKEHPIHFPDLPPEEECSSFCVSPYSRNNQTFNTTNVWTRNYTENDTDEWSSKSLRDCVIDGGNWTSSPVDVHTREPEVFFMSVILFAGTFAIAMALKGMKTKPLFPNMVKQFLSDFCVIIAIVIMVVVDIIFAVHTPKLRVPSEFRPTDAKRSWIVDPVEHNPWWLAFAAIIPALLATILLFMDQQITLVIINRKENKLVKGHGYHLDLFLVATLVVVCSILGLPWYVTETVLSITHVMSLKRESECSAPGESPKFLGVWEQRGTGIAISVMIGASVLLTEVLKYIPMPVLYGVFLYMGVSSLHGMQIVNRISIWFMPQKYQPDYTYLRHVPTRRVHLFTLIQVLCLIVLWIIKSIKKTSIAFPIMVLGMCFIRKGLDRIFTQEELKWLDDIMPEVNKRAKEDELKRQDKEEAHRGSQVLNSSGTVQVPLISGNVINIPVERITVTTEPDINISEEMSKSTIWKTIVANESSNSLTKLEASSQKKKHKYRRNGKKMSPLAGSPPDEKKETSVKQKESKSLSKDSKDNKHSPLFYIAEDETDKLLEPKHKDMSNTNV
ncbi:sodium bicarbonate cotransporter 3-like [Saccostrea echinata]|uniref:sodium bicarbonate cotransporter 3-like n=1 Tax=Saccostrea echinata TaxID=191078 RepID=UPI002A7FDA03|nr:sodium bicarbonate cotransporter 3-like [Saccostrea echinata]